MDGEMDGREKKGEEKEGRGEGRCILLYILMSELSR